MPRAKTNRTQRRDDGVIYDFGMNNGDDVEYYLMKADRVVGIDANPALCDQVRKRFSSEISDGRLVVLNVALAEKDSAKPVTFYVHKHNHVLSQLPKPERIDDFQAIKVPCRTPAGIINEHGRPIYVKVDVEGFDFAVLQNLFDAGIRPPELSAEAHSIDVFAAMVVNGYDSFVLVEGSQVSKDYADTTVATAAGPRPYRFRHHSAGPFGEDIRGRWEDADSFFRTLAIAGLGWKDIHASLVTKPEVTARNGGIHRHHSQQLLRKGLHAIGVRTVGRLLRRT